MALTATIPTLRASWPAPGRGPRWRRAVSLVTGTLVAALSFSVMLLGVSQGRADAFVSPTVPILIGETLASPAAEVLAGGACVGTVVCGAVVGGAALALGLYMTKDSWLPTAKTLFANAFNTDQKTGAYAPNACTLEMSLSFDQAEGMISGTYSYTGCGILYGYGMYLFVSDYTCIDSGGVSVSSGGTQLAFTNPPDPAYGASSASVTWGPYTPCGAGQKVTGGTVQAHRDNGSSTSLSSTFKFGSAIPGSEVSQTTVVHCVGGAAGAGVDISRTQVGHPDQIVVPSCADAYPGSVPTHIGVTGGRAGAEAGLLESSLTNPAEEFPDCFDSGGAFLSTCRVRVWIDGVACSQGVGHCGSWTTAAVDYQESVECRFGHYVVELSDCNQLKTAYQTGAKPRSLTETNSAGEPSAPGDPDTGGTSVPAIPETGVNPDSVAATDSQADPDSKSCFGGAWSWNPVDWVYVPVKCSLLWAFKPPDGAVSDKASTLTAEWNGTAPAKWTSAFTGLSLGSGVSGCEGLPLDLDLGHGVGVHQSIGAACSGSMAAIAALVRVALSVMVVVGGGMACVRALGSGLGWNPGVGPGGEST